MIHPHTKAFRRFFRCRSSQEFLSLVSRWLIHELEKQGSRMMQLFRYGGSIGFFCSTSAEIGLSLLFVQMHSHGEALPELGVPATRHCGYLLAFARMNAVRMVEMV